LSIVSALLVFSAIGEKRCSIDRCVKTPSSFTYINKEKYEKHRQITNNKQLKKLRFKPYIYRSSPPVQWFLVYSTIGVYNFAHIVNINYRDPDYLKLSLFSRFYPEITKETLTPKPIPFPPLSSGTEFFAFFLYGGTTATICAFIIICSIFGSYIWYYAKRPSSIFLLLGFLKLTFSTLTLSFGRLFFAYSHLVFLLMVIFIYELSRTQMLKKLLTKKYFLGFFRD
jgi:hypothetical protein